VWQGLKASHPGNTGAWFSISGWLIADVARRVSTFIHVVTFTFRCCFYVCGKLVSERSMRAPYFRAHGQTDRELRGEPIGQQE